MASLTETLAIKLIGDISDFTQKMGEAEGKVQSFGGKMQEIGGKISSFGGGLTLGVTAPLLGLGTGAIDAASDLEESMNKVNVVFGDSAGEIQKWAEGGAKSFGLSKQNTLEAVGTFGNLFDAMGIGTDASADMSTELIELAADLASFNNMDPTEVLEKLRAGLVGETEPLRSLGVNLTAATVEAAALESGIAGLTVDMNEVNAATVNLEKAQATAAKALAEHGADSLEYRDAQNKVTEAEEKLAEAMAGSAGELTAAEKAQAAYKLIMEQTATAQGDFARTSDGLANQQRIAKAEFEDAAAVLGEQLLPIGLKVVEWITDALEWFQKLSPETQRWILIAAGIAAALGPVLVALGAFIGAIGTIVGAVTAAGPIITAIGGVIALLGGPITLIVGAIVALALAWSNNWFGIRDITKEVWEAITTAVSTAWEALKKGVTDGLNALKDFMSGAWEAIKSTATTVWEALKNGVTGIWDSLKNAITTVIEGLKTFLSGAWEAIKSTTTTVWEGIKSGVSGVIDGLKSLIEGAWNAIKTTTTTIWEAIKGVVSGVWEGLKSTITGAIDSVKSAVQTGLDAVKGTFTTIWDGIKGVVSDAVERIKGFFQIDWGGIGRSVVEGIVNGIKGAWQWLLDTTRDLANAAFTAAKQALGIGSPSKKGLELGLNFGESLGMGAEKSLHDLTSRINASLNTTMSNISPRGGLSMAGGMMTAPITINFYGNVDKQQVAAGVESGLFRAGLRQVGLR